MARPFPLPDSPGDDTVGIDAERWERLRGGDDAAFEALFRAHAARLADLAFSYVQRDDVAEEIVHATFCWLWDHRFTLEAVREVRGYLYAAVRNRARNALRDERAREAFLSRLTADGARIVGVPPAPDAETTLPELEAAIARAVAALPERCREVFTLVRQHGVSHAEAAGVLGIAPKTVEIHMGRALKLLRARLAPWITGRGARG